MGGSHDCRVHTNKFHTSGFKYLIEVQMIISHRCAQFHLRYLFHHILPTPYGKFYLCKSDHHSLHHMVAASTWRQLPLSSAVFCAVFSAVVFVIVT